MAAIGNPPRPTPQFIFWIAPIGTLRSFSSLSLSTCMSQPTVSTDLQSFYDSSYDGGSEVRRIRAIDRVNAIRALCADRRFETVLEVGAGEGSVLQRLDETCFASNLFGLEISASGVEAIQRRGIRSLREVKLFDGYAIPYPDKTFDLAYATQVL